MRSMTPTVRTSDTYSFARVAECDAMHITIQKGDTLPKCQQCQTCCTQFHCPFCAVKHFKPTTASNVNRHLKIHFNRAVQHEGYTIHRCGLGCRPQLHYHCIYCQSMLLRKEDFGNHLVLCKAKQSTTALLSKARLPLSERQSAHAEPCSFSGEPSPASRKPCSSSAEPCTANTEPCPMNTEPCPASTKPCSSSADPSLMITEACPASTEPCPASTEPHGPLSEHCSASAEPSGPGAHVPYGVAMHVTIQKGEKLPLYHRCRTCCDKVHCPFCAVKYFKPTITKRVNLHLKMHFHRAVQHEGYTIHRCGLGCRPQLHYHCIYCQSMLLRKEDFNKHLILCKAKQSTKAPLSKACPVNAETSGVSGTDCAELCQVSGEPCAVRTESCSGSTEACPSSAEPCPSLSEPCPASAEQSDSGIHEVGRGRVRPVVRIRCPKCNVLMNKRNIGKHIIRKHTNLEVFDVNATYQCTDEANGIFAVQETLHGRSGPLCVQNNTKDEDGPVSSETQHYLVNMGLPWRSGMRSHRGVRLRMSSSHPVAALCQMTSTADKAGNFATCAQLVEDARAAGASMVFLPEGFDYIGSSLKQTLQLSETLSGETITRYSELARTLGVWLSLGGFHERGENWETRKRIYNSHVIISDQGDIVSVYRKGHLFDVELTEKGVSLKESSFTIPGPALAPPVETPIGKVGLAVCYDLRFPEHSLALQRHGAEILTYPSAFTVATGTAHWEVLLRARAVETQCYVLAAAQVGPHHAKRSSYGHALAVDPWGTVLADLGATGSSLALVEVDLQRLRDTRRDMPVQQHRREEEYYRSLDAD